MRDVGSAPAASDIEPAAIVEFGRRWYLYGGGPAEDIMTGFGWTPRRFFIELEAQLRLNPPAGLSSHVVQAMGDVCRSRIWMGM